MAITIDGSGTVTGISAGGLPDGVITPADLAQPLTLGTAQASTSGTFIDFTGIPSWAKRVTVMFNGVSLSGTTALRLQIGAGSVDSAATYNGGKISVLGGTPAANSYTNTAGFEVEEPTGSRTAATTRFGRATLTLVSSNTWVLDSTICCTGTATSDCSAGSKTLSGTLDRIRITTLNGTDTFDAGSINILYE